MNSESHSPVLYERDGRIGRITLNRPHKLNAIDDQMPGALSQAVARANDDQAVHVIVLSGAGRAFCSGYDLEIYAERPRPTTGPRMGLPHHGYVGVPGGSRAGQTASADRRSD